ncbi:MAG TPA: hypothetical protein VN039_03875 [Nitrospira sp.]|nr:hypothetical protein [Nitrospira sp.]
MSIDEIIELLREARYSIYESDSVSGDIAHECDVDITSAIVRLLSISDLS